MSAGYYGQDQTERMLRARVQERWMDAYAPVRHLDPVLVITAVLLAGAGMAMIYSATLPRLTLAGDDPFFFVRKQAIAFGIGLAAMVLMAVIDYRWMRTYSPLLYLGVLFLLIIVLTPIGTEVNGSQRWIPLGGFNLQPSELAKLGVIIAVAALLHEQKGSPGPLAILGALAIVVVPMGLVFVEPDLGTSIVFVWLTFILLLVGGVKGRYLIALAGMGIGGIVMAFRLDFIEEYQLERLTAFLDAGNADLAQTSAFHTQQSLIAVGSGQFFGKGYRQGTQNSLAYVPENHTDFIFTVVGEELGFLGAAILLALFTLLIWRGLRIAMLAKDMFGTLLAAGVVGLLVLQVFVNVGMTIGIMPVTGIPLPFMSYGGTSLIMWMTLIGMLLNVHMRRFGG
jgi:rod shape determining protein RodA